MKHALGSGRADAAILLLASLPLLFWQLGDLPVVLWDESRLAVNALEMSRNGPAIVTTYAGQPDLWNTKPPLLIWLMAASISLLGTGELALRLPSALAALATVMVVWAACRAVAGRWAGLAAAAMLLTTVGFVGPHVARTGDYDALLVLFSTIAVTACFKLIADLRAGTRPSWPLVIGIGAAVTGAILTKGIAGLLVLPGIGLAALVSGVAMRALRAPRVLICGAMPLAAAALFYAAREAAGPGYLAAVWANELGGRYGGALEGHEQPAWFYVAQLFRVWTPGPGELYLQSAAPWSWIALVLLPLSLRDAKLGMAARNLAIVITVFLLVISSAGTRIAWYLAPAYPLVAMLAAINLTVFYRTVLTGTGRGARLTALAAAALLLAMTGLGVIERNRGLASQAELIPELRVAARLQDLRDTMTPRHALRIARERQTGPSINSPDFARYSPQERFYVEAMRADGLDAAFVDGSSRGRHVGYGIRIVPPVAALARGRDARR